MKTRRRKNPAPGYVTAIIVAGGRGTRLGMDLPKPLVPLGRRPLVAWTLETFERAPRVDRIVLVCGADWLDQARDLAAKYAPTKTYEVVAGGEERADSVRSGMTVLPEECTVVAVHDAARPFVPSKLIADCLEALRTHHGAVPGLPLADTLRRRDQNLSLGAADRARHVLTQTPQCFHREVLANALNRAFAEGFVGTDDASYVERLPVARVAVVEGHPDNFKITTPSDLERARLLLIRRHRPDIRVGEGYDAHRLVEGRPLILGGVTIPFDKGLLGHSDADVLCHAITDALLGAAGLGDLGKHFPDNDPQYRGISSLILLERIADLVRDHGFTINSVDTTLVLEQPRIAPHREAIIANLVRVLDLDPERISVKATTTEGMGFEGRGEGISARAVVVVGK
ncbi:MAG: 2-C-methyl-D-erythritol 2,4-cyclodiphosphate synthase [Candidatus Zixiibacteriota bacterium]|nr:MAG: 2-C-methyl-D-erythritol 2,4-cyclodiphosphate synthase [candidate division Zixibacteria bacterium]